MATLRYSEAGHATHPPLLLLHPGGVSHHVWLPMLTAWSNDYHILAPDLAYSDNTPFTIPQLAQDVTSLVQSKTTQPIWIVGSSLGANVALQMAVANPSMVRGLILDSAQAGGAPLPPMVRGIVQGLSRIAPLIPKGLYARALMRQFNIYAEADRTAIREGLRQGGVGAFIRAIQATEGHDVRAGLESLTMPILLTNGANDPLLAQAKVIRATLPHAEHFIFEGSGHSAFITQPTQFIKIATAFLHKSINGYGGNLI